MKPLELSASDAVLSKKRMFIESVIKELKTQTQVEHSRHRSFVNFQVNVVSALIAYQLLEHTTLGGCLGPSANHRFTYAL